MCSINTCVPGSMSCIQIMQIWNNYNEQYNTELEFNECSQIIILLLLLIWRICLCMCPDIPVHIHPYTNKMSLVIETDGRSTNYIYIGSRAYPWQWPRSIWYWVRTDRLVVRVLLYDHKDRIVNRGARTPPRNTWWHSGRIEVSVAQHLTIINM